MTKHKSILVVSPDFPYPPNHGGRVDVWKRLQLLHKIGYDIDLVSISKTAPTESDLSAVRALAPRVSVLPRRGLASLFGWKPHQVAMRGALAKIDLAKSFDVVMLEGSSCAAMLSNPTLKCKHIALRVHNDEARYFRKLANSANSRLSALYYFLEGLRFGIYDTLLYRKLRHFLFISRDECEEFKIAYPQKHAVFLPPHLGEFPAFTKIPHEGKRVLFIGSLFMPNNRDGLQWFLAEVHPRLRHIQEYKLVIAGNTKGVSMDWLLSGPYASEIEFHDSPPDLASLYASADIFINPMRFGAGMKIKTVEAVMHELPIVTTETGREGTGLQNFKHVRVSDDPKVFADAISQLLENPTQAKDMAQSARDFVQTEYNVSRILTSFLEEM